VKVAVLTTAPPELDSATVDIGTKNTGIGGHQLTAELPGF